jgi:Bacteriophytochrome (light-regulated signal transduction histidine kinase)
MISHEQRGSLREFLYRKPGLSLPEIPESPAILNGLIRDVFEELQRSRAQLSEQVDALEAHNKELKDYAHMVADDLKEPLTILIMIANLIRDVGDLTPEELKECLLQVRSTAYEMRNIIKSLLLFSEVSRAEAPRGPCIWPRWSRTFRPA